MGAVFGVLSGVGPFLGMFSAVLINGIAAFFSGTRLQVSTPTAPMIAAFILLAEFANGLENGADFVRLVLVMSGVFLLLAAFIHLEKYVRLIPNIVISGFMTGIAAIVVVNELRGKISAGFAEFMNLELFVSLLTLLVAFLLPLVANFRRFNFLKFLPLNFLALVAVTIFLYVFGLNESLRMIEFEEVNLLGFMNENLAASWNLFATIDFQLILKAFPWALEMALIAFLDTLLTALIIEQKTKFKPSKAADLRAQSLSAVSVGLLGLIPGAQSTVPSVLLISEGAKTRLAAISVFGGAGLIMFFFADYFALVPSSVFSGFILKIAYDIADFLPFKLWIAKKGVVLRQIAFIGLIIGGIVFLNVNFAIFGAIAIFFSLKRFFGNEFLPDLQTHAQSEGFEDEG
jgi:SulP family sulfate permease